MLFPGDPSFSEADARRFLDPVEDRLRKCAVNAFADHVSACGVSPAFGPALDYLGTRAQVINALVVEHVRREFADQTEALATTQVNGFLELLIRRPGDALGVDVRFKLVDKVGRSQNAITDAQWCYRNELPLVGKSDAGVILRVTLGWRWNAAATGLEDIVVVYVKGDEPLWMYSILKPLDPPAAIPIPLPQTPPDSGGGVKYASKQKKNKGKDAQGS